MAIAVITGASSGLGGEYVRQVATRHPELKEIWLIARRRERLEQWQKEFPQTVFRLLSFDLSREKKHVLSTFVTEIHCHRKTGKTNSHSGSGGLIHLTKHHGGLINNAGLGTIGDLYDMNYPSQTRMVDVNVRALTALTTITLQHMEPGGHILNVCSIASFAPNPRMTVYCSTKAYVLSFTKSLGYELRSRGISVTAVCPGPMSTEFLPVAGIEKGVSKTFDTLPYCDPRKVAEVSLRKAEQGKTVYTPRLFFKFYRVLAKVLPHNWIMPMSKA